jgi:hypothetical protein
LKHSRGTPVPAITITPSSAYILALAPHSTKLVLPASATTLRSFTSLEATCAAVSGFHWSSTTM